MAEPLSSHEIEDVLSSIRRLVAQDLKPADRAKLAAVADISQKLVLTPENRVEERVEAPKFVTVRRPSRRAAFPAIEEVLAGVDAGSDRTPEKVGASGSDWALGAPSAAEYIAPQPAPFALEPTARLSQVAPEEFAHNDADTSDHSASGEFERHNPTDISAWTEEPEDIDHLDAQVTTTGSSIEGTIEPDPAWADEAEARVIAELAGEAMHQTVHESVQTAFRNPSFSAEPTGAQDVMFDEQALRILVQTVFREEMAGPMGERITRNIRKLVRAEVGRMLAAHDLE